MMKIMRRVYSEATLEKLNRVMHQRDGKQLGSNGQHIYRRARILGFEHLDNEWEQAYREAWSLHLEAAQECGMLDDRELLNNLAGTNDEGFRGAMAECLSGWLFSKVMSLKVSPKPNGKHSAGPDFLLHTAEGIYAETKAPFVPLRSNTWSGDDSEEVLKSMASAKNQFVVGRKNLLVIVPTFRTPVWSERDQLTKAILGEEVLEINWSAEDESIPSPLVPKFVISGKLAKERANGARDLTRLSAVLTIEEFLTRSSSGLVLQPRILVFHNPFAAHPIAAETFSSFTQCVPDVRRQVMFWTETPTD